MGSNIEILSEKEKETLRLIVRGHDAKSMARELNLSVHTINDRLRAARRKLEVTSSKEAARVLLECESEGPEKLAHERLGAPNASGINEPEKTMFDEFARHSLLGALAMITLLAAALLFGADVAGPADQTAPITTHAQDKAVVAAARDWLAHSDAGDWQAGFNASGQSFQEANTAEGWARAAMPVRAAQGALVSRDLLTVRYMNAPPQGFQEVAFATRYANSEDKVIETVTLQLEDGIWKVVGIMLD